MAIYKDYGTPPKVNVGQRVVGQTGGINQKGNVTLLGGQTLRGQDAPLARALRTKETSTVWAVEGPQTLEMGNLNGMTGDTDESQKRFRITSLDGETDIITLGWDGSALTVIGTVTGSRLEMAVAPTAPTTTAFSADADGNLTIAVGSSVSGEFILRRIDGV